MARPKLRYRTIRWFGIKKEVAIEPCGCEHLLDYYGYPAAEWKFCPEHQPKEQRIDD